jgi:hypothetical protein
VPKHDPFGPTMMQAGGSGKPVRHFCRGRAAYKSGPENRWSIIDQFAYLIANNP